MTKAFGLRGFGSLLVYEAAEFTLCGANGQDSPYLRDENGLGASSDPVSVQVVWLSALTGGSATRVGCVRLPAACWYWVVRGMLAWGAI